jgi:hypothetical protein
VGVGVRVGVGMGVGVGGGGGRRGAAPKSLEYVSSITQLKIARRNCACVRVRAFSLSGRLPLR